MQKRNKRREEKKQSDRKNKLGSARDWRGEGGRRGGGGRGGGGGGEEEEKKKLSTESNLGPTDEQTQRPVMY